MYARMFIFTFILTAVALNSALADHPVAHTHIGVNPTWRPDWSDPGNPAKATDTDLTDNDKLWFFSVPPVHPLASTPGWPEWRHADGGIFLQLVPVVESGAPILKGDGSGKQLWICEFLYGKADGYGDSTGLEHLDGWHSAHGPQGMWNLASTDESTSPAWDIHLRREGASVASDDFFMLLPNDATALTTDGDVRQLGKEWMTDKNAWGIHEHMSFAFWLAPDIGQQVTATFSAFDAGGLYAASDNYEFAFVTVPEPGSLLLLGLGAIPLLRRKATAGA